MKTAEKQTMKKDTKQTLISLSLAESIGFYLYNKLEEAGLGINLKREGHVPAKERTEQELSWRPEPVVEEPVVEETEQLVEDSLEVQEEQIGDYFAPDELTEQTEELSKEETIDFDSMVLNEMEEQEYVQEETLDDVVKETEIENTDELFADQTVNPEFIENVEFAVEEEMKETEELPDAEVEQDVQENTMEEVVEENQTDELFMDTPELEEPVLEMPTLDGFGLENEDVKVENEPTFDENAFEGNDELNLDDLLGTSVEQELEVPVEPEIPSVEPVAPIVEDSKTEPDTDFTELDLENFDDLKEDEKETSAEDLMNAIDENKIMDNVEPLHKLDEKDVSSKQEFKDIMDFFKTL